LIEHTSKAPTATGKPVNEVGLKGATRWRTAGDVSTAGVSNANDEERSEPPDASESGLSR
jgi:hypothetical protein